MERFRLAAETDADTILEMMHRYYAEDGYPFVEVEARKAVLALIGDQRLGRLWVAQEAAQEAAHEAAHEAGRVVGYLAVTLGFSLEYRGRDAFIDELFISEGSRGQGLGREALEIAEAYCRQQGVKALHLEVETHRQRAQELYRRVGYEPHERYLMTKLLNEPLYLDQTP